ncbi:MAG: hypothetical protein OER90_01555 [Gemmatimonadota bacterium]|nr:hypothetical protein [Gemmatimonadota bacterium]
MTMLRRLSILAVFAAVAACSDQTGPQVADDAVYARGGRWATLDVGTAEDTLTNPDVGTTTCTSDMDQPDVPPCTLRHRADAPPLESYHPSFEILVGFQYHLNVFYAPDPETGLREYFLTVTIPRDAEFFDESGNRIPKGQPVVVTMDIDPVYFQVEFGPHGTLFNGKRPGIVRFSLVNAVVEGSTSDLSVYYRPQPSEPEWSALPTTFDRTGFWIEGPVYHFSGYAVAW